MIYLVTSIAYWDDRIKSSVVRGVYTDVELAKSDVEKYCHDLCEYYYNYIVIEGRPENQIDAFNFEKKDQVWYELTVVDGKTVYASVEAPKVFQNCIGFS